MHGLLVLTSILVLGFNVLPAHQLFTVVGVMKRVGLRDLLPFWPHILRPPSVKFLVILTGAIHPVLPRAPLSPPPTAPHALLASIIPLLYVLLVALVPGRRPVQQCALIALLGLSAYQVRLPVQIASQDHIPPQNHHLA